MKKYLNMGLRGFAVLAMIATSTQALAVDYTDFSRPASITKKVFKLYGDFGNCGGAGNPDTELRIFTPIDLGGGVTKEIQTRRRYVGGLGGTLCVTFKEIFIKDATANRLVQRQKFSGGGALLENVTLGYNAVNCPDCGIELANSTMTPGVEWATANEWEEKVGVTNGIVLSKMVLLRSGFSEIINEGYPSEQTFANCMETWEDRATAGPLGNRSMMRRACQDIGFVIGAQVDTTSGTPVERLWVLKSYVQTPP